MRHKKIVVQIIIYLVLMMSGYAAGHHEKDSCPSKTAKKTQSQSQTVDFVLERLQAETRKLKSYSCRIEYLFSQPLFDSKTVRKGVLYYKKEGDKSALRINFETIKQDDEKEQRNIEQYIFDGEWLTVIDYQIREVKRYQQAEPNEAVDVFAMVSRRFPIIGFGKTEDLKKEFEIEFAGQQAGKEWVLHLKVRDGSIYKDDYSAIDFWIDKKIGLPVKIIAASTEEEIYQIEFIGAKANEKLKWNVFSFKIPKGFGKSETILIKEKRKNKKCNRSRHRNHE